MDEIRQFFGKNLKRLRVAHGYTQEKLSEKIGINQRQLTRIETGRSFPSFATLDSICNILGVSANELFDFSSFGEILKNGTNNVTYYVANKTEDNVIVLTEKARKYPAKDVVRDNESIQIADEQQMFQMAEKIQRPILVEYFNGKELLKKVTYYPNRTSNVEIPIDKNDEIVNEIIDKLNVIKTSLAKLKYIKLAMQCLEDKSAIIKMQNMLEGMAL